MTSLLAHDLRKAGLSEESLALDIYSVAMYIFAYRVNGIVLTK